MIRDGATDLADRIGIPVRYLESSNDAEDEVGRTFFTERTTRFGPIAC